MTVSLDAAWLRAHELAAPAHDTNKNERGRIVVVGGSRFVPGALRLTGEAALRAGAGKLQLGTIAEAAPLLGMFVPEAAVFGLPASEGGELDVRAAATIVEHAGACDALVLGPGMSEEAGCSALVLQVLRDLPGEVPVVLDAAAIGPCRDARDVVRARAGAVVLTPHHGEMASLTGAEVTHVARHAEHVAREVAAELGATVVLKAARTFIVAPDGETLRYDGGTPALATGGSGDLLAGILGGLIARGVPPVVAAGWAVMAHGAAGTQLAAHFSGLGLLSRDLLGLIPGVLNGRG